MCSTSDIRGEKNGWPAGLLGKRAGGLAEEKRRALGGVRTGAKKEGRAVRGMGQLHYSHSHEGLKGERAEGRGEER